MDEAQLEAFLAVSRYGSFKEASRHLHLAQSTVTSRLQALERRLGVILVDRARGRPHTTLTPEGEDLLVLAERWEEMAREMAALTTRSEASLIVGAPDSVSHYILAPLYGDLARSHPELALRIETANSAELYDKLERREVDLAFVLYDRHLPAILIEPFISEEMLLLTCAQLEEEDGVARLDSLDPKREIHVPWGAGYERWRLRWLGPFSGYVSVDTAHLATAFLDDRIWTIVPASMARAMQAQPGFRVYRLADPPPPRVVFMARRLRQSRSTINGQSLFDDAAARLLPAAVRLP